MTRRRIRWSSVSSIFYRSRFYQRFIDRATRVDATADGGCAGINPGLQVLFRSGVRPRATAIP
jgi:hypothetical protein